MKTEQTQSVETLPATLKPRAEATLDYYVKARGSRKRNYVFDFKKARSCTHPDLHEMVVGSNFYRCMACNYSVFITGSVVWPLHFQAISGVLNLLYLAKEFGPHAVQEMLRRPIGQYDGLPQKPALPEGMTFVDAVKAMGLIDVNTPDGGKGQLAAMLADVWVGPKQKAIAADDQARQAKQLAEAKKHALSEGRNNGEGATSIIQRPRKRRALPPVQDG